MIGSGVCGSLHVQVFVGFCACVEFVRVCLNGGVCVRECV